MKFILFIEGYTENRVLPKFLKKWLDPRLDNPVGIKTVRFDGWQELVKDAPLKARMHLSGPGKDDIIAIISLLDLYGPNIYPDELKKSEERYRWGKEKIEKDVGHEKFVHFFAVHEVEAWLLSQPEIFPLKIKKALSGRIQFPEKVNFDEPPAKMLQRLYSCHMGRSYKKVVNGQALFDKLNPEVVYNKCPGFRALMDTMLNLAKNI